jgi:hypothetical protein
LARVSIWKRPGDTGRIGAVATNTLPVHRAYGAIGKQGDTSALRTANVYIVTAASHTVVFIAQLWDDQLIDGDESLARANPNAVGRRASYTTPHDAGAQGFALRNILNALALFAAEAICTLHEAHTLAVGHLSGAVRLALERWTCGTLRVRVDQADTRCVNSDPFVENAFR